MNKHAKLILVAGLAATGLVGGLAGVNAQTEGGFQPARMHDDRSDGDRHDGGQRGNGHGHGRPGMMGGPLGMFAGLCQPNRDALLAGAIAYGEKSLEITPDQMQAWTKLTAALNAGSARVAQSCEAAKAESPPKTSTERLAFLETRMSEGLAILQDIRPAYDTLYTSLTDVQKKTLEDMLSHRMARHGGPGDHRDHRGNYRRDHDRG